MVEGYMIHGVHDMLCVVAYLNVLQDSVVFWYSLHCRGSPCSLLGHTADRCLLCLQRT